MPIQKITSGVIESSQTLTTPTISGNLSLDSTGTTGVRVPSANTLTFHTAGTEDMRITSAGYVGIGASSPNYQLEVRSADPRIGINNTTYGTWFTSAGWTGADDYSIVEEGAAERFRLTNAGNLMFNSGYGSVATAYGCRAWVNFNGQSTVTIRGSGNVSSITDNGAGTYTINFTTAMPDVNYAAIVSGGTGAGNTNNNNSPGNTTPTASAFPIQTFDYAFNLTDWPYNHVAVFR